MNTSRFSAFSGHHSSHLRLPSIRYSNNGLSSLPVLRLSPRPCRSAGEGTLPPPESEVDPKIAGAFAKVQEAIKSAETSLENVQNLPSARIPTLWDKFVVLVRPAFQVASVLVFVGVTHSLPLPFTILGSLLTGAIMAAWGYKKGSLSPTGAIAAALVGLITCASSFRNTFIVLAFFFSSSKLTQLGDEDKAVDEAHKSGGQRDWQQVACNALVPCILTTVSAILNGGADLPLQPQTQQTVAALTGAFLGYYSCCCGDTWASELGQLSPEQPRLITSFRPVRKGTNGGVTLVGLASSIAGGMFMGLVFYAMAVISPTGNYSVAMKQWQVIPLGLVAGLVGSLIDSILGATVQFTGYNRTTGKVTSKLGSDVSYISGMAILDNNMVNLVSATLTAALTGFATLLIF